MVMAATFTGALSLLCQLHAANVASADGVRIDIRDGAAEFTGLEDMAFARGAIANRGRRGALRLVAITPREPESDIWADLIPNRQGGYALAFYSTPHGAARPRTVWGRGQCQRQGTSQ
jgi:hypothetical protein